MSNSFFHFKQFSIKAQSKGLKVTTDACLLGSIAKRDNTDSILDIGTGTGVIALMLAQAYPMARITALEIQDDVYKQAFENIQASPFADRINLHHTDFLKSDWPVYDLIVCNPPYFTEHLRGTDSEKNIAMHNTTLPHDLMFEKAVLCMHNDSLLFVILPYELMDSRIEMARTSGLFLTQNIQVYKKSNKAYRTIACFSKTATETKQSKIILHDEAGNKTVEFSELMKDYYLDDSSPFKALKNSKTKQ